MLERIQQWFRSLRVPTFGQLLRIPAVLDTRERLALAGGVLILTAGIALLGVAWYRSATVLRPAVGGTYVEGLVGEPRLVNPIFAGANDVDADLVRILYAGLFRVAEDGAIIPDLAERSEHSEDGKTVTITLREGVRWHDGAEVTADDVLFTLRLIQDPTVASPLRGSFRGVTAERVDARTVRLTIDRPFAALLSALTVGLLPEHLWSAIPPTHLALAELNLRPVGAGPYRFTALTKDKRGGVRSYTVERYAGYHRTPALLARIVFRFSPEQEQVITAFNNREVDGVGTLAPIPAAAITRRDAQVLTAQFPSTTAVFLNPRRNAALRDVVVRRALDRATDREAIATEVLRGSATAIGGPLIVGFSPTADPPPPEAFDSTAAEQLLDRAQWTRTTPEQYLAKRLQAELRALEAKQQEQIAALPRAQRPKTVPPVTDEERSAIEARVREELTAGCVACPPIPYVRMKGADALAVAITTADLPERVATAERIRNAWRAIGVRATVAALPTDRIRSETIPTRAYDALLFSQVLGPDPDPFPFWHSSQMRSPGLNLAAFTNRTADKLLEDARATTDRAVRAQKYAAFQKILAEERPAIFLTTPTVAYPIARAVAGVRIGQITVPADRFATVTEWYTTTTREWTSN